MMVTSRHRGTVTLQSEKSKEMLKRFEEDYYRSPCKEHGRLLKVLKKWDKMEKDGMTVDDLSEKDYVTLLHAYKAMCD